MKKTRSHSLLLDLWACFVLPAYTLLFAGSIKWFSTNFSVLAVTGEKHYRGFLLWGLLAGGYFLVLLVKLARTLTQRWLRRALYGIITAACGCLGIALPLPYLPELYPDVANLHTLMAFSASVMLMWAILMLLLRLRREDGPRYRPLLRAWVLIVAVCGVLFGLAGIISTALEVFFTISAALLVLKLWINRREQLAQREF